MRIVAVSADKRQEGINAPTLKEEGIDVELFNWRGVFAPPGVNDTQRKAMIALIEKMTATPQWAEACKTRDWTRSRCSVTSTKPFWKRRRRGSKASSRNLEFA